MNNNFNKPWSPLPEISENFISELKKNRDEIYNAKDEIYIDSSKRNFKNNSEDNDETVKTENGAVVFKSSNSKLLNLNYSVSSLRNSSESIIANKFKEAFYENPEYAICWLFYCRDIKEGLGERRLFSICFKILNELNSSVANALIPLIPKYGRWDDLLNLLDINNCKETVLSIIQKQIREDNNYTNHNISLLAKWLPSEQASNPTKKRYAKIIRNYLNMTPKNYRKLLSSLRKKIDIVERKISSNNWQSIDYEKVPSKANILYNNAFYRHDRERRTLYLDALKKGEAKINASAAYPHDIVHKYLSDLGKNDSTLEAIWKSLPNTIPFSSSILVVADGSFSMESRIGNTNLTALEVADSLAIYFSEKCKGAFKNTFITFSMTPQIVHLTGKSLRENLIITNNYHECANTDIKAVFDLVLDTAIKNNMNQEDLPKSILILSDMEFDECARFNSYRVNSTEKSLFANIEKEYHNAGYNIPKLIFWNLCSRTCGIPMKENKLGVVLVSGFNTNICKTILLDCVDPYEILIQTISNTRYNQVRKIAAEAMINTV